MTQDRDKWIIRFGQAFQSFLKEPGEQLEDHLYFLPTGVIVDRYSEESSNTIDLHVNRNLCQKRFSNGTAPVPSLDAETAKRLNAALVIVPGFGHHLVPPKVFAEQ
jgi:hypothetical protein